MDITPSQPEPVATSKRNAAPTLATNSKKKSKNKQVEVQNTATAQPAEMPSVPIQTAPVESVEQQQLTEDIDSMIATAAYYLAERRNFAPGHELEDWLEAEQQVRR